MLTAVCSCYCESQNTERMLVSLRDEILFFLWQSGHQKDIKRSHWSEECSSLLEFSSQCYCSCTAWQCCRRMSGKQLLQLRTVNVVLWFQCDAFTKSHDIVDDIREPGRDVTSDVREPILQSELHTWLLLCSWKATVQRSILISRKTLDLRLMETETWLMQKKKKKKHACRSCYGHSGFRPGSSVASPVYTNVQTEVKTTHIYITDVW